MNITFVSCHSALEFDEVRLLSKLPGVTVRSIGAYADPRNPTDLRPAIETMKYDEDHMELIKHYNDEGENKWRLDTRLVAWSDTIIYMHLPNQILRSLDIFDLFPTKKIIYRSIGQSSDSVELSLTSFKKHLGERFKIVRYSPNEAYHFNFAGSDALIRFYKNPNEWQGWQLPSNKTVLFALQAAPERGTFGKFDLMADATEGFDRFLIGPRNEGFAHRMRVACPSYEDYKRFLRTTRLLCYGGMLPASYTLSFIEALMSGMPIVALDKTLWLNEHGGWCNPAVYEVDEILQPECIVHSYEELKPKLEWLLNDDQKLKEISTFNRNRAIELFSEDQITKQWRELLGV